MVNNLHTAAHQCRQEIFGITSVVDVNKKSALMENLKASYLNNKEELPSDWIASLEPIADSLCAMPHVQVVSIPTFMTFEYQEDKNGDLQLMSKPHTTVLQMVASWTGFVDQIKHDTHTTGGVPKTHYIYSFLSNKGSKIIRYCTYATSNRIVDGLPSKKEAS